jgi:16S rRNA (guanine966-N2)-methyltransferase
MLRITGGEFRGRSIQAPANDRTRPTQAKLRQALFNSLQTVIGDARVLDLFAGSGALGFEALSWGASEAVFVESARSVVSLIEKNAATLGVRDRAKILSDSVESFMVPGAGRLAAHAPFDLVLADPPYAGEWEEKLLNQMPWEVLLVPNGHLCIEWGTQKSKVSNLPEVVNREAANLVKVREKNYGDSVLTTYRFMPIEPEQEGDSA